MRHLRCLADHEAMQKGGGPTLIRLALSLKLWFSLKLSVFAMRLPTGDLMSSLYLAQLRECKERMRSSSFMEDCSFTSSNERLSSAEALSI